MAIIRNCFVIGLFLLCVQSICAQNISYPAYSSQLLKSTAADAVMLFGKAIPGNQFTISQYAAMPQAGIIFIYDSTIDGNLACRVQSDGVNYIKFSAAEDNGLCFGFYQYLQNLGFRFYQPGSIWEIIPALSSVYKTTDSIFNSEFKYSSWTISGGHNRWIMDMSNEYTWDSYAGENGHNWALYQRRNCMTGAYRFAGHRGDIMTGNYLSTLQTNPCYVACYDSSRAAGIQSVPDVNNTVAMDFWANTIEQKYTQYKNTILNNANFYVNQFRNFKYAYQQIGIEVPDAAKWGNSSNNQGCANVPYAKESDQQITLANYTAQKIAAIYPDRRFQIYAYSTHADVPSPALAINNNIDIQLIPAAYQTITSTNGLRNRWYNRSKNISEYNYLNLSVWSGETPSFSLSDFKATVQIAKDKKSQGLVWETSPTKFISLPYLMAAGKDLNNNIPIDKSMQVFCDDMFAEAGKTVYELFQFWTDSKNLTGGVSNKYKIAKYLEFISKASLQIKDAPPVVKGRMQELKAYLHYIVLYQRWSSDPRPNNAKAAKAAELCVYLAKVSKMQLVNSYVLIEMIARKYSTGSDFYREYNVVNGTAYQNGNLPLITAAGIENDFAADEINYGKTISDYNFETSTAIKNKLTSSDLTALPKISVELKYTNGLNYYNRAEFYIMAPGPGNFTIDYKPVFDIPDKGYINFLVESADKALEVIEDFTLNSNAAAGALTVKIPAAGTYKLTISSMHKSSVSLLIKTNKNVFYKSGAFFGKTTEIYKDNVDMPGYFYVPSNVNRIYFSFDNSYSPTTGYASAEKINSQFEFRDSEEKILTARLVTPNDSALFYIDIPAESKGKFCRITKKSNYNLIFSNISNYVWYAQPKPPPCSDADFRIAVITKNGNCFVQLTAVKNTGALEWEVTDMNKTYSFANQRTVELPGFISPNALVTLSNGTNCSVTKKLKDETQYSKGMDACVAGAPLPGVAVKAALTPNPSTGNFTCMQNAVAVTAAQIIILDTQGAVLAEFKQVSRFNIGWLAAGLYWYKIKMKEGDFNGKLVKL